MIKRKTKKLLKTTVSFRSFMRRRINYKLKADKGLGMVEIIVVIAVITVSFTAILQLFTLQTQIERVKREELAAYTLLSEALEATRAVRDDGWGNLSSLIIGVDYYPVIDSGAWILTSTDPGPINGYSQWVVLESVERDGNDDIVSAGGTVDTDTVRVTAYVQWRAGNSTTTKSLLTYLTNWQGHL